MLFAAAFLVAAPDVAAVIAAARTTTSVRAAMLLLFFIWKAPRVRRLCRRDWYRPLSTSPDAFTAFTMLSIPIVKLVLPLPRLAQCGGGGDLHRGGAARADLGDEPVAV